jgi:hypothetical protein
LSSPVLLNSITTAYHYRNVFERTIHSYYTHGLVNTGKENISAVKTNGGGWTERRRFQELAGSTGGHYAELCVKPRLGEEGEQRGYYRHRLFPFVSRKEKAMPVAKNKPTTRSPEGSTSESSSPVVPDQEEFRQHLRRLAVSAVQVLLEQVMREELEQCIGASWGECTPTRRGYRNGSYTRDLVTPTGRIEDLKVPRDRAGAFHTQVFERYGRYEPEVAEALTDMFVSGTSTHRVGKVAEKLLGVAPSASAVSRLNQALTEQYEAWRVRRLLPHYRIIYLDGIHFTVRHGTQTDATMILTALGVDLEGSREVLAFRACAQARQRRVELSLTRPAQPRSGRGRSGRSGWT